MLARVSVDFSRHAAAPKYKRPVARWAFFFCFAISCLYDLAKISRIILSTPDGDEAESG